MLICFDYHIHTYYSFDSLNRPLDIIKIAMKKGIHALSITDHNTIKGSVEAYKLAKELGGVLVIKGVELTTKQGDLIILGIQEEIRNKDIEEVFDIAKAQGYLTILPHPYVRHTINSSIVTRVDAIEVYNSRTPGFLNRRALKLATRLRKPITAGSDAHVLREIGNGLNFVIVEDLNEESLLRSIKKGLLKVSNKPSNPFYRIQSMMIQIPRRFSHT